MLQAVHTEIQIISDLHTVDEITTNALEQRVSILERDRNSHMETAIAFQIQLEDMEDRNHQNNLRLWGLPETINQSSLNGKVMAIFFLKLMEGAAPINMELDRLHRALGPKCLDPDHPRDVICRLHNFTHREMLLQKAWEAGMVDLEGAQVKLLPDLSRAPLQRRALLWKNTSFFTLEFTGRPSRTFYFFEHRPFPGP